LVSIGNLTYDHSSVVVDAAKNVYQSGAFSGSLPVGTDTSVFGPGGRDFFLMKKNQCGKLLWVVYGGSTTNEDQVGNDGGKGIATDADGNVYMVGRYNQICNIYGTNNSSFSSNYTNNPPNGSAQDGFLVKISPSGQILWGLTLFGGSNDGFNAVTVDAQGNPIVSAVFNGDPTTGNAILADANNVQLSIEPGTPTTTTGAIFKFNANGQLIWKSSIYNATTTASGITTDAASNIYVTGWANARTTGNSTTVKDATGSNNTIANTGEGHAYLVKLNSSGIWQWGVGIGNEGSRSNTTTFGRDVRVDASGNAWIVGYYTGNTVTAGSTNASTLTLPRSVANSGFVIKY
jgi:hypothetical protein